MPADAVAGMAGTLVPAGQAEGQPANLRVTSSGITAHLGSGEAVTIPFAEVELSAGGFDGTFIFVRTRGGAGPTITSGDKAFLPALEQAAGSLLASELAKITSHKRKHGRARWIGIGVVLAFFALIGILIWNIPRFLARSVDALPTDIDQQLGDAAYSGMTMQGPVIDDPVVVGFVQEIVDRLAPEAKVEGFDFRVTVVDSDIVNAFALPGGQIVVFTGLIEQAERPEQVAGVLGHEMAHVTLRHGMRNVAHSAGVGVAFTILLGDASGWVVLAGEMAAMAQQNSYSRVQEAAADEEGVRMLMAAGLDPEGLAEFFQKLEEQPGAELQSAMSWVSTHPDHQSRIAHVHELMNEFPAAAPRPLTSDWQAVRAAIEAGPASADQGDEPDDDASPPSAP